MLNPAAVGPMPAGVPILRIGTKADLLPQALALAGDYDMAISTRDSMGLAELLASIGHRASLQIGQSVDILPRVCARRIPHGKRFCLLLNIRRRAFGRELRAEDLRLRRQTSWPVLIGAVDVQDLLKLFFAQFVANDS